MLRLMSKRPTLRVREAEKKLLRLLKNGAEDSGAPLPPVRQLGVQLGLSYATVSRLLQRFAREGLAWQHPNGRFFPVHAGPQAARGLPVVVLGRQIQHWSRLYQQIIEGVSEICAARGCPLVFLSSDKLVRHESPELPPVFASMETQGAELKRLIAAIPRLCGGVLLDHLWDEEQVAANLFPAIPKLLLARPSRRDATISVAPNFQAGAHLLLRHFGKRGYERVYLGVPFGGDQAVDSAGSALRAAAASGRHPNQNIEELDCSTPALRKAAIACLSRLRARAAIVCTEDNVASLLWRELAGAGLQNSKNIELASMQGTGLFDMQMTQLRYDYHQLGRDAVAAVLERHRSNLLIAPRLMPASRSRNLAP